MLKTTTQLQTSLFDLIENERGLDEQELKEVQELWENAPVAVMKLVNDKHGYDCLGKHIDELTQDFLDIDGDLENVLDFLERIIFDSDGNPISNVNDLGVYIFDDLAECGMVSPEASNILQFHIDYESFGSDALINDYIESDNFIYRA